jgi:hypothetical protein
MKGKCPTTDSIQIMSNVRTLAKLAKVIFRADCNRTILNRLSKNFTFMRPSTTKFLSSHKSSCLSKER